ncbi:DUF4407 domain-containing protein [Belliella aquatica]|uniref:DUF4407 domain-containing protein n=1 Tax=Belliella aquatica TaxID=1323734 RepID=A0ABQ1M8P9_9BACT|nr:DUF4407 domain-containing protein [Belliella aquatica]MCH7404874.1 DUF4407 domain-containing protein [Belliella aquatica]GGC33424.1 hypothetical protein GCM10010993_10430 [Belliella aquatica]
MKNVNQFFWFCSGANFNLLKRAPTESNKYVGIGGTIFFTGLLATISAGYALFTIFQSVWYALAFGLVWGLMIFNLDRFIVSSMRKRNHAWTEWKMALPRLVMAVILALVISKPLELKIFEREINRKLDEQKTLMIAESKEALKTGFTEIDDLEIQKDSLKSEVKAARAYRDKLQQEYDFERFGTKTDGTSGIVGLGSNAKKKEQQLDAAQQSLTELELSTKEKMDVLDKEILRLASLREAEFEKIQPNIDEFDGLAARIDALAVLTSESRALKMANLMIVLLFVAIETAPIFVKIISPRGPYDELLDLAEKSIEVYSNEKTVKLVRESEERLKEGELRFEI